MSSPPSTLPESPTSSAPDEKPQRSKKRSKSLARELQYLVDNNGKRAKRDLAKCPICQHRIEPTQWEQHYQLELQRLNQLDSDAYEDPLHKGKRRGAALLARQQMERSKGKKKQPASAYDELLGKVQKNREHRREALARLDPTYQDTEEAISQAIMEQETGVQRCFICNDTLHGDSEAINLHIDRCLASFDSSSQQQPSTTSNSSDQGAWDEYEWAGQTRVRATAMMEGGYGGAGFATASKREEDEDEEDLDVEDDGDDEYGAIQYSERDIVFDPQDEDASALREMVSGASPSTTPRTPDNGHRSGYEETVSDEGWRRTTSEDVQTGHSRLVIESLKSRIQQLEITSRSAPRCLICLEPYKTPVTSIVCWHVHCEQCWLHTLGSKKLCPQCQKITTPSDLRRIYL
ncbi:ring finger protein 220 [Lichtheimia corymbifera JMRC:FSU:9682]|uniref:Ring finger protein 220 n=1 Tax=Lichtheimia corymbifera JMRC:FSU:9682 TaxID=1263082 RepID=A0A068SB18_9FUNG|nr:ring finger protein 220 [Lichtheimia corymbifera JMRC:FSU:9682]